MALKVEKLSTDPQIIHLKTRRHQEHERGTPLWLSRKTFKERFLETPLEERVVPPLVTHKSAKQSWWRKILSF